MRSAAAWAGSAETANPIRAAFGEERLAVSAAGQRRVTGDDRRALEDQVVLLERDRPFGRRDIDLAARHRFGQCDGYLHEEIVVAAVIPGMPADVDCHIEVARRLAIGN